MIGRYFCGAMAITSLLVLAPLPTFAQSSQLAGRVLIQTADGQKVSADGALVDFFRTDAPGHWDVKADKRGNFIRLGLPLKATFVVAFCGARAKPYWIRDVKVASPVSLEVTLQPGDGSRLTYAEIQAADRPSPPPSTPPPVPPKPSAKPTPATELTPVPKPTAPAKPTPPEQTAPDAANSDAQDSAEEIAPAADSDEQAPATDAEDEETLPDPSEPPAEDDDSTDDEPPPGH